ncbi:DUF2750 domain-containing protein [Planktosalinus lacus]|uniref:DUF2750 domain-containing protein n=1 Tax=Planktosalinus lacus TaxID=1526573 RepID=A0A8J2VEM5_9FLAO|nr:DUF2750 domain-containing protein [Planktosalinus lacus]GGD99771.1 hypothetical protein GCM10011312_24110 [Planktosalinus lacus]
MNIKQLESVFKLESKLRYGYLIRKIADFEQVFLIADKDGNYVTCGADNEMIIPIWPELVFAQELIKIEWKNCIVKMVELKVFMKWMDKLEAENYFIGGFPNQKLNSIVVKPIEIKNHLIFECEQYE